MDSDVAKGCFVIVLLFLAPVVIIWCLNGIFLLGIAMTPGNYFMMFILVLIFALLK